MYKCLCGRFPFVQPGAHFDDKVLALKLIQAYASAAEAAPLKIPRSRAQQRAVDEVVQIVTKSLRKAPKERFESAEEMRKHIERLDRCFMISMGLSLEPRTRIELASVAVINT